MCFIQTGEKRLIHLFVWFLDTPDSVGDVGEIVFFLRGIVSLELNNCMRVCSLSLAIFGGEITFFT